MHQTIINTSKELGINVTKGTIYTSEIFDVYENISHLLDTLPKNINLLASEMEAFGIFTVANFLNKETTCLVSISDSPYKKSEDLSLEKRQTALDNMIILALESIIKR